MAANHDASNWTAYAGSNLSNHYTPGAQITPENVKGLKVAWEFHTGDLKPKDSKLGYAFQNTPLKVGDLLYICTPTQKVIAVEAANGRALALRPADQSEGDGRRGRHHMPRRVVLPGAGRHCRVPDADLLADGRWPPGCAGCADRQALRQLR